MNRLRIEPAHNLADSDWMPFPGGELEGKRPRVLCPGCRARVQAAAAGQAPAPRQALCFQCYRLELERNRALVAAGDLHTASEARFQTTLPFEPVNRSRLARLKVARQEARTASRSGPGQYVERRRKAQIEARHTLANILRGLRERQMVELPAARVAGASAPVKVEGLQLPEAWLPFVAAQ
jgi:hypothetical protein